MDQIISHIRLQWSRLFVSKIKGRYRYGSSMSVPMDLLTLSKPWAGID